MHVWTPPAYDPSTAGIVVYVHGYYTDVDRAWERHRLPEQFAASALNALFVACEAPAGPREQVQWTSLRELLDAVASHLDASLPQGRVVAVGHSGAHRTLSRWVAEESSRIETLVLLDAFYGDDTSLPGWLNASKDRRLINVAADTRRWAEQLHRLLPDTVLHDSFPSAGQLAGARDARILYVRSQFDHMTIVTGGVVIPLILRAARIPLVTETLSQL
ncbi:MAG: hypothetical protein HOV81_29585 [Kofleriaceae bacterium]|nr:hypothetical protein [Kofleriaceae bacterium]